MHSSDDTVLFSFCGTIMTMVALAIITLSVYGIADARSETSVKLA